MNSNGDDVPSSDDGLTLPEIMFHAERFCLRVESAIADCAPDQAADDELRLKLGQCRNLLSRLQTAFEQDQLTFADSSIRADFRYLVIMLLWVAFWGRRAIDYRLFRMLVLIEAGVSYLLVNR